MPDREVLNLETHHEKSDVNVRALLWSVAIFIVFAFVTHFLLYGMYRWFAEIARGQVNDPMTNLSRPASVPQEPRLQPFQIKDTKGTSMSPTASTPVIDMVEMRRREDDAQQNAAWIDQSKGQVRLPIDVAKQIVVQRGLPVNVPAPAPAPAVAPPVAPPPTTAGAQP